MLLKDNKKGLVTVIMKRMKGMSPDMTPSFDRSEKAMTNQKDGAEQDYEMAMESASKSMIDAIKSGDAKSFSSSLKSFIELCEDCEGDDD